MIIRMSDPLITSSPPGLMIIRLPLRIATTETWNLLRSWLSARFFPANGETKRAGNEIETLADSIRHSGTLINSVEDFMLD